LKITKHRIAALSIDYEAKSLALSDRKGNVFRANEASILRLIASDDVSFAGKINFRGHEIAVYANNDCVPTEENIVAGHIVFKNGPAEFANLPVAEKYAYLRLTRDKKYHGVFSCFPDEITPKKFELYANLETLTTIRFLPEGTRWVSPSFKACSRGIISTFLIDDQLESIDFYSFKWLKLWNYKGKRNKPLMANFDWLLEFQSGLVMNWTMERDAKTTSSGEIHCISIDDGSLLWTQRFPHQVDSLQKENDDTFLALASDKLYRLASATGDVIATLDTGFSNILNSHFLFIADEFCFAFNSEEQIMHIIHLDEFRIVDTLNMQGRKERFATYAPKKIGRKVYVSIKLSGFQQMLAEIDLDALDLNFEYEHQPNLNIVVPTDGYGPITMTADGEYLGDLLRYIEFTAVELAEREGNEGRSLGSNKHFNGVISVTCRNTDTDGFNLEDCFRRLKAAIERETNRWGMRCGKGKNPITFEYRFES